MAKDKQVNPKVVEKPLSRLNQTFQRLMGSVNSSFDRETELDALTTRVDDIVSSEVDRITGVTGDDISTFLVQTFNEQDDRLNESIKSIEDIFGSDKEAITGFLKDRYKNRNLLYEDLSVIAEELFELREAINTTSDAVVTSDEMTAIVSRTIQFRNIADNAEEILNYQKRIESMEKEYKLLKKIKNHIVPNTLEYGTYYVYSIPYSRLFANHVAMKSKEVAKESWEHTLESFSDAETEKLYKGELGGSGNYSKGFKESLSTVTEHVSVLAELEGLDTIVEATEVEALIQSHMKEAEKNAKNTKTNGTKFQDKTIDVAEAEKDFDGFTDVYIKLIDPRRVIPVTILEKTIGYYYIHNLDATSVSAPFSTSMKISANANMTPEELEMSVLGKVSDKIVKSFNKPYLEKNQKFKDLIVNSLLYNDIYKKKIKFQFIPVDYMTEYSVNHNESGEGVSILKPAMFYAKLYLSLLVFKMVSIISKSNDTRIHYIKNSGVGNDVANQIQSVARNIRQRSINFTDLMSHNSMMSKIGANRELFMPVGSSGERGIEFEILSGQDIPLNTDLMEMLRSGAITSTGVPSVIMNYVNEADYAKTLVMANNKFAARVANLQSDINAPTTELYKKLLRFSKAFPDSVIDQMEFILSPPRALSVMNAADVINNTDQVIMYMTKAQTGEQQDQTEESNMIKDEYVRLMSRELLPSLPWSDSERIFKEAALSAQKRLAEKKTEENSD